MEIGPQGRAEESKFAHAVAAAYLSDLRQFVVEPVLVVHGFLSPQADYGIGSLVVSKSCAFVSADGDTRPSPGRGARRAASHLAASHLELVIFPELLDGYFRRGLLSYGNRGSVLPVCPAGSRRSSKIMKSSG